MALNYKQITDLDSFAGLRKPWNELVTHTEVDHAFMRHEWFECWIKNLGVDGKLSIRTAWDGAQLVGIAPLHIVRRTFRGIPLRVLSFLQSGITPRCNFIVHESLDLDIFFESIFAIKGWDIMELKSLDEKLMITQRFLGYLAGRRPFVIEAGIQSPFEVIESDWETYLASRSKHLQRDIGAAVKRSSSVPSVVILKMEEQTELQKHFCDFVSISQRSWKVGTRTDLSTDQQTAGFYREFSDLGGQQGLCVAYLLIMDGKPIAFDYYVRCQKKLAALRWEYDQNYNYHMPGLLLHSSVVRDLASSGEVWEYDLSGDVTKFKASFAKDIRAHINIAVGRPGMYGSTLMLLKRVSQRLRHGQPAHSAGD